MKDKHFQQIYANGAVLNTKIDVHTRFSSIPTDIPAAIASAVGAPSNAHVLDIGCGTGHMLRHLRDLGHRGRLVGLDLAIPPGIDTDGIEFVTGDAEALPWQDDSYDIITAVHMLGHLTDIPAALAEATRVLRPDGVCVISANSDTSYPHTAEYRRRVHELYGWGEPVYTTTRVNLENLAQVLTPWRNVEIRTLTGKLRIPYRDYLDYFAANTAVWAVTPTADQLTDILDRLRHWAREDLVDGHIIEPKTVGIAVCTIPT
ncbi:class I SAM-dependent methyltransferase [Nocardia anaemiae]|uniref:class I SAM-dependent methyltransferase n=1 Tax=Nocardia anaemiae TaxID=263910 RepID=UPI0007A4AA5A|nr:class I SAM-dependent methyltransferase [Nocardia anaemiae]